MPEHREGCADGSEHLVTEAVADPNTAGVPRKSTAVRRIFYRGSQVRFLPRAP
jgi:hypothetical protein